MKLIDNINGGLVIVIDWPLKAQVGYKGFDGKEVWPGTEWQSEESDTLRYVTKIIPSTLSKLRFNPIVVRNGLVQVDKLNDILKYQQGLQRDSRLLYLQFSDFRTIPSKVIGDKFSFSGYDYGNYMSEDNFYSVICNEITSGSRVEFKAYAKFLNHNLLFSSLDTFPALEKTKAELLAKGEHLEEEFEDEEFQPIAIYSYNE